MRQVSDGPVSPLITVVISTRNRGESIFQPLRSVLLSDYPNFAVVVVDQSENDLTEAAVQPFLGDPRVRYIRSPTKGVSTGHNIGISAAQGELISITGDDCEVASNCLQALVDALETDRQIGIVFGNVLPTPYDRAAGFAVAYVRSAPEMARSIRDKHRVEGMSGCMGLRRSMWQRLGGFDQMLGAGAPLRSAGETDLTIRALLGGYFVYETPAAAVTHHGFRTWEHGRPTIQGYLYGIGATLVKHLKCGHWSVLYVFVRLAWRWAFAHPVADLGDRSYRWLRLWSFVRGCGAGAFTPVDRTTGHYVEAGGRKVV